METYLHTQTAANRGLYTAFLVIITIVVVCVVLLYTLTGRYVIEAWIAGAFILLISYNSPNAFTIAVDGSVLTWSYCYLLNFKSSRQILLADIASVEVANDMFILAPAGRYGYSGNSFYSAKYKATGTRFGRGFDFIKILKKDGTVFLLGTDEPQVLVQAIQSHIGTEPKGPLPQPIPSTVPKQALQMFGILIAVIVIMSVIIMLSL